MAGLRPLDDRRRKRCGGGEGARNGARGLQLVPLANSERRGLRSRPDHCQDGSAERLW